MLSTAIFVYAATAPVNGYSGGSLYARMGGKMWIRQVNTKLINCKFKSLLKSIFFSDDNFSVSLARNGVLYRIFH